MRGDGRIYQRGGIWWVQYSHRGQKIRESSQGFLYNGKPSDGTSKRAAEKMLQERRRTAGTAQFIGPQAERVTFEDLADRGKGTLKPGEKGGLCFVLAKPEAREPGQDG